jgi:hypothetical protein
VPRGQNWTPNDVAAYTGPANEGELAGRAYHEYVDGTGSDNGWFSDGFAKLGSLDAAVQDHKVVNIQLTADMALNARRTATAVTGEEVFNVALPAGRCEDILDQRARRTGRCGSVRRREKKRGDTSLVDPAGHDQPGTDRRGGPRTRRVR